MRLSKILERKEKEFERKNSRRININSDIRYENLHLVKSLNYSEINYLLRKGWKAIYQQDLYEKINHYLIKPPLNESKQHCFLVQIIKKALKNNFEEIKEYRTREPDIVFRFKNRFVALEIETGKVLSKNKKRFLEKVRSLNEKYGEDWFVVVTNRNFVGKYGRFGKTLTRKNFLKKISSYVGFDIK